MQAFTFLITDDRYSVPSLAMFVTESDDRAAQVASDILMESEHHKCIEVLDHNRMVHRIARAEAYSKLEAGPAPESAPAAMGSSRRMKASSPQRPWWFRASLPPAWWRKTGS